MCNGFDQHVCIYYSLGTSRVAYPCCFYINIIIASSYGYYLPLADQVVANCLPLHEVNAHVVVIHVYCCKYADLASRKFSDFLYVVFRNITVRIYVSHIILIICFRRYYSRHVFISKPYTNVIDF